MIKRKDRIYIAFGTYFIAMLGLFFTGTAWWFTLLLLGILYVIFGGKKHV